ncbi:sigma-70 family RNA polymerase sigma factor [Streptomyces sp. HUAS TT7]|uniref:sigma-70 family RNA polymerase sigma factor n=1 Tax=Streptomyces sp. HUAS TT7 TaxID=3447507 RepID=UPI003F65AF9A
MYLDTESSYPFKDAELVEAVRGGHDERALAELYRCHRPAVLAYARSCCRDPHTAEDLAAEAFARTLQAVRAGRGPEVAWRPYLLTVVRRTAANWADTARRVELSDDFERWLMSGPDGLTPAETAEERLLRMEDGSLALKAFRTLPERWQTVLWHMVVERESAAEVGSRLGLSATGAASLASRAREGLREAYLTAYAQQRQPAAEECGRARTLLAASLRRPRGRPRDLERHLGGCVDCHGLLTALDGLNEQLGAALPTALLLWGGSTYLTSGAAGCTATAVVQHLGVSGPAALWAKASVAAKAAASLSAVAALAVGVANLSLPDGDGDPAIAQPQMIAPRSPAVSPSAPGSTRSASLPVHSPSATPTGSVPAVPSSSPPAAPPSASARETARTPLTVQSTGWCMEAPQGDSQTGRAPQEAVCDGGQQQVWNVLLLDRTDHGDQFSVMLQNGATKLCLRNSGSPKGHSPVSQQPCTSTDAHEVWRLKTKSKDHEAQFMEDAEDARLGLDGWYAADKGDVHRHFMSTNPFYNGSDSMRFRYEGALFSG